MEPCLAYVTSYLCLNRCTDLVKILDEKIPLKAEEQFLHLGILIPKRPWTDCSRVYWNTISNKILIKFDVKAKNV
jgi:hypothetical protein